FLLLYWLHSFIYDIASTDFYSLSLHDALPISGFFGSAATHSGRSIFVPPTTSAAPRALMTMSPWLLKPFSAVKPFCPNKSGNQTDRKSTRLNSSHVSISYAVFCLKKRITIIYL